MTPPRRQFFGECERCHTTQLIDGPCVTCSARKFRRVRERTPDRGWHPSEQDKVFLKVNRIDAT